MARSLTLRDASHLLRRAAARGRKEEAERLASVGLEAAVESLLATPAHPPKPTFNPDDQRKQIQDLMDNWLGWWLKTPTPAAERLVLFWHGHFTTEARTLPGPASAILMWTQFHAFRSFGYGPFSEILGAVARDPAMLIYLDNATSRKEHPNENWARELMELYTTGVGNYTENDVLEAARAFTGWSVKRAQQGAPLTQPEFLFRRDWNDSGPKTFLGKTIKTGEEVLEILSNHPETYRFVGRKLLRFYFSPEPAASLVDEGAKVLREMGTREFLRWLFTRDAFYSPEARNTIIKSPVEYLIGLHYAAGESSFDSRKFFGGFASMGQVPFNPPNVKGWDGGMEWVSETPLLTRLNLLGAFSGKEKRLDLEVFMDGADGALALVKPEAQLL